MTKAFAQQLLSMTLSILLVITSAPLGAGGQSQAAGGTGYSGQAAPLTANELEQLVAPIALYPDALVAQILAAATYPDEVSAASNWLQQHQYLKGADLMQAVDTQSWDPSVKALTQFPSVLGDLVKNLSWTSSLGEAYGTQAAEVMTAVQVLRAKAQAAGNLKSGSQITVVQQTPQVIVIQPANPQIVYVPQYNPTVVYGYPYVTPGYSTSAVVTTALVGFGVGIAVGAMMSNSCCGWGYSSWNCGWHGTTTVVYRGGSYYGNTAWRGGAYGPYGSARYGAGYNPATGTYARGGTVSNGYGTTSAAQAYNPRTGASASTVQNSNRYGSSGASTVSRNGNTAYSQHQSNAYGTTGSVHTSNGGRAYGASGAYNSAAVGQTANGDKYASANGNIYKNTGSGWNQTQGTPRSTSSYSSTNSAAARGYGGQEKNGGSSAFGGGGGGGWQSREASGRGWASRGGGGGWGGRR